MSTFLQFHLLTSYPPSNLNRDDLGQPKSALLGGINRIRVSSQSLKRAWRTSAVFEETLSGNIGTRTKRLGAEVYKDLLKGGLKEKIAEQSAKAIAEVFGKLKSGKKDAEKDQLQHLEVETLVHVGPSERKAIDGLAQKCIREARAPKEEELDLLRQDVVAADIALFGRMLASKPTYNIDASAQIAHAITVHKAAAENDYFTAVDDLNSGDDDRGSAHIGDSEFSAGLFYLYGCINVDLLVDNLRGDRALAQRTLEALLEAASTVSPTGKQNSFGSRAYASYCLLERGFRQPRTLSHAFLKPIAGGNMLPDAISSLEKWRDKMDAVYGPIATDSVSFNADAGTGTLAEVKAFARDCAK
jgi:CRISPR system Cascade subunit CasC